MQDLGQPRRGSFAATDQDQAAGDVADHVMQDGIRTGDLSSQSGDHGVSIDPAGLARIEVVKGPATLLYGSSEAEPIASIEARALPGVTFAAYFAIEGQAMLALEGAAQHHGAWTLERVRAAVAPAPVDRVVARTRLPRDVRHHSKPDLERLRRTLS